MDAEPVLQPAMKVQLEWLMERQNCLEMIIVTDWGIAYHHVQQVP